MAPRQQRSFWQTCRIYLRRVRITVWLLILALVGALVYLNQIGLPGFVKDPLLDKLRASGLDLQFSRLRVSWYRGVVAENVRFGRPDDPSSPQLTVAEVLLQLDHHALAQLQFRIDSLVLRRGRLIWPILETNRPPRQLSVTNIQTQLRLLPNDEWALDKFAAGFAGASIHLSGTITNASSIREWGGLQARRPPPSAVWQDRLRQLADTLENVRFFSPPDLRLDIQGDARNFQSFAVHLVLSAPGADTPWGTVSRGRLTARLFPGNSNELSRAELNLEAAAAHTPWAATTNLQLTLRLATFAGQSNLVNCDLALLAGQIQTKWAGVTNAQFAAQWVHTLTNPIPLSGQGLLRCDRAITKWASARNIRLLGHLVSRAASPPSSPVDPAWAWWTNLQPYRLTWECHLTEVLLPKLAVAEIACVGNWCAPELTITNLEAKLYQGQIEALADLNVATRALNASLSSDLDPHNLAPALPESAQRWLAPFSSMKPPRFKGDLSLVLPAWTNGQPDWHAEVLPTLCFEGEFKLDHGGAYRGVSFSAAQSHIRYSNLCWHLPDLAATRPEGRLEAEHRANDRTKDFYWRISSSLDPLILRSLLETDQQCGLDLLTFTQPPVIEAEIWGRSSDRERTGFRGRVALTNFSFRGQSFSSLRTALQYTNRLLQFFGPTLQRGERGASADGLTADFAAQLIYLTNGFSTTEPLVIASAIGAHVARAIEPYCFARPPTAHVYGVIPMHGEEGADLHFQLDGGPFQWSKFKADQIVGRVHWLGEQLTLDDVRADFYRGQLMGNARFQFHPHSGTDLQFALTTTNTQLHLLMADLFSATNKLEGRLSGSLSITNANTDDPEHVFGYGNLILRDGLIWDIPLFGILSPILDGLAPGLGSTRANAGTCSFLITNTVIRSDDLEIRASAMRLQYRGTVDFDQRVNARVEAELLRDMWLVGPIVSTVFTPVTKMFEYKVTGTLDEPKLAPVFIISKLILLPFQLPFHPLRTLKGLLPEDTFRTNASPPAKSPTNPEP